MKYICNVDWLELYCSMPVDSVLETDQIYKVKHRDYGTRVYKDIYDVYLTDATPLMTVCRTPLSSITNGGILRPDMCHVKIANYWLYTEIYGDMLKSCLRHFRIKPLNISRLDLCCDFQFCQSGLPANCIMGQLMTRKLLKIHQGAWTCHANDRDKLVYNSMSFGSKSSPVFTRFYNKTKELQQVCDKPYIRDLWVQTGFKEDTDVYRVEFALTDIGRKVIDKETGVILDIELDHIVTRADVTSLFLFYASHYFDLRKNDNDRKSRCTPIYVFPQMAGELIVYQRPRYGSSTRADKITCNRLLDYMYSDATDLRGKCLARDVLLEFSKQKRLDDWLQINRRDIQHYMYEQSIADTDKQYYLQFNNDKK